MKHNLLLIIFVLFALNSHSQSDTSSVVRSVPQKTFIRESSGSNINIYPVPVRQDSFTIRTDREMKSVRVTNMIGQDIFRADYKEPIPQAKVILKKPTRGMYLVTIGFTDGTRIVKKIMIENPK
ncbi:MAG: T9SS type A sorting domain-containing protein [Bacteroidales bacterium]|jgi:hypothetical protein|nr:T9SS type A sorting domain-containing protein [Bacteroidales bacterium]